MFIFNFMMILLSGVIICFRNRGDVSLRIRWLVYSYVALGCCVELRNPEDILVGGLLL